MNETIGEALHVLTHSYRHLLKEAAQRSGIVLPVSHIRSLKCIGSTNQCRARDICTTLRLDKSQVARILKALLNKGYIAKKSNPSSHRSQLLFLTSEGESLLSNIKALDPLAVKAMTDPLSAQQIEDFVAITKIMTNNIKEINHDQTTAT